MIKLSNAKSINIYRDGAWQNQKMGYVYYNGGWVSFIEYGFNLYDYGEEYVVFSVGRDDGNMELTKEKSHISIRATDDISAFISIVSEELIDVGEYNTLLIEWEQVSASSSSPVSKIGLSSTRYLNLTSFEVVNTLSGKFEKKTTSVDISDFEGEYYVAVQGVPKYQSSYELKIHKIWLE